MIITRRKPGVRDQAESPEKMMGYSRIIVPVHGTHADRRAIEVAGLLGSGKSAEIVLVHVVEVAQSLPLEADLPVEIAEGEQTLREAEEWARQAASSRVGRISPELLQARSAGTAIVDEAVERGAEVIVMALCQHRRHGQPTPGKTVPYVLMNAPCEVIVTRLPSDCD
jgi:nucleotide-binding universal stress UspA family protein